MRWNDGVFLHPNQRRIVERIGMDRQDYRRSSTSKTVVTLHRANVDHSPVLKCNKNPRYNIQTSPMT